MEVERDGAARVDIADQIEGDFYKNLTFVVDTAMPAPGKTWKDYAFEQKTN